MVFPIFGLANKDGEPLVIGFAGSARSGKDTATEYLCKRYRCLHYSFAKPIKEACKIMFQLTDEQEKNKEEIIEPWGYSPRKMYQHIGTDIGRSLDPNIWVKNAEIFRKKNIGHTVVISDVRFTNEAFWIRNKGGVVIRIHRPNKKQIKESSHASEHGMKVGDYDFTIVNDGTIQDLYDKLDLFTDNSIQGIPSVV